MFIFLLNTICLIFSPAQHFILTFTIIKLSFLSLDLCVQQFWCQCMCHYFIAFIFWIILYIIIIHVVQFRHVLCVDYIRIILNEFKICKSSILCLTQRTTVTSLSAPNDTRCKTHPLCVNLGVPFWTCEITHKLRARWQASSPGIRADVTVVLEVRQSISSITSIRCLLPPRFHWFRVTVLPHRFTINVVWKLCPQIKVLNVVGFCWCIYSF